MKVTVRFGTNTGRSQHHASPVSACSPDGISTAGPDAAGVIASMQVAASPVTLRAKPVPGLVPPHVRAAASTPLPRLAVPADDATNSSHARPASPRNSAGLAMARACTRNPRARAIRAIRNHRHRCCRDPQQTAMERSLGPAAPQRVQRGVARASHEVVAGDAAALIARRSACALGGGRARQERLCMRRHVYWPCPRPVVVPFAMTAIAAATLAQSISSPLTVILAFFSSHWIRTSIQSLGSRFLRPTAATTLPPFKTTRDGSWPLDAGSTRSANFNVPSAREMTSLYSRRELSRIFAPTVPPLENRTKGASS